MEPDQPDKTTSSDLAPDDAPTIVQIKNNLREKVGGSLNPRNIQAAALAVKNMADELSGVMAETLNGLINARAKATHETFSHPVKQNAAPLFKFALDLKSSGSICGFPLITRVAHSLCRLLAVEKGDIPSGLVDAHIQTLRAILRDDIKSPSHPVADALAVELEKQVFALKE